MMAGAKLRLEGKTAIVTGASSGIGRAAALAIARQGAKLVVCADLKPECSSWDVGKPTHDEICAELGDDRAMSIACDVALSEHGTSSYATLEQVVAETVKRTGRLDIIVNNAGILVDGPLHEMSEENWNKSMNVDAGGSFRGCKYAIAQFLEQDEDEDGQRGCIINMSSPSATHGTYGCAPHCASQAAIAGLTRAAAVEYSAMGIRVNALCPGYTETAMIEACLADEQLRNRFLSSIPQRRFGRPSDVAGAVVWLACGAESAYVNGSSIYVDGAFHVF